MIIRLRLNFLINVIKSFDNQLILWIFQKRKIHKIIYRDESASHHPLHQAYLVIVIVVVVNLHIFEALNDNHELYSIIIKGGCPAKFSHIKALTITITL